MPHQLKILKDLKPAPYNPREITPEAAKGLSASIAQFGDISGIVWNKRTGHIVAGHQRLSALLKRGATFAPDPPRITLHDEAFAIRVVDWDAPTEKAANITANNPHISGDFVEEDLQDMLHEIEDDMPASLDDLCLDALLLEPLDDLNDAAPPPDDILDNPNDVPPSELANTNFTFGEYRFTVTRAAYMEWRENLRQEIGFAEKDVHEEIRKRLALAEIKGT